MSDELVDEVRAALDPTPAHEADWPVSRRRVLQGLASVGALSLGPGAASGAAGTASADQAFFSNYGTEQTATLDGAGEWLVTIDGETFTFGGDDTSTIGLPDGGTGTELVTPSGATASEVVGPDGNVVFDGSAIPDSANLQAHYVASSFNLSDGNTVSSNWTDESGNNNDAIVNGAPTFNGNEINGEPSIGFDAVDDYFDTGITVDTTNPRSTYVVLSTPVDGNTAWYYGATASGPNNFNLGQHSSGAHFPRYGDSSNVLGDIVTNQYRIDSYIYGGGSAEVFMNQSSQGTMSYSSVGSIGYSSYIGGNNDGGSFNNPLECSIAEILDYNANHGTQTREDVEAYLNAKYSIV